MDRDNRRVKKQGFCLTWGCLDKRSIQLVIQTYLFFILLALYTKSLEFINYPSTLGKFVRKVEKLIKVCKKFHVMSRNDRISKSTKAKRKHYLKTAKPKPLKLKIRFDQHRNSKKQIRAFNDFQKTKSQSKLRLLNRRSLSRIKGKDLRVIKEIVKYS